MKKKPIKKSSKRKVIRTFSHTHIMNFLLLMSGVTTILIGGCLYWFISLGIPDIRSTADYQPLVTTTILDRHGRIIDTIFKENRYLIPLDSMPEMLPLAFVAAEDGRFFEHGGLDFWSIFRAVVNNLRSGHRSQGGSTITQQVTRALLLTREKSYFRKFKEAMLAYRLERMLTKEEILFIYLNEIYFGQGAYGIEAAAREYFNKHARQLNLSEITLLAGLPQAPSRYSPISHFNRARIRQRYVLNRMVEEEFITPEAARKAYHTPPRLIRARKIPEEMEHYIQQIRHQLEREYGQEKLFHAELTITTSLDSAMQKAATRAILSGVSAVQRRQQEDQKGIKIPQGALVAMDVASGEIRALVGGTHFSQSQYNRAVQARRRPGSVFKPIIYAAAFEKGLTPETLIEDAPLTLTGHDGRPWKPKNFSGKYYGPTSLHDGLVFSRNIVAIKLLQKVGFKPVINLAGKLGISSPLAEELPLALGTSDVSLLEMTSAYNCFAAGGIYHPALFITSISDAQGRKKSLPRAEAKHVLRPQVARQLDLLLQDVITKGTGRAAFGLPVKSAGKTGTSDNNIDAWFVGYTSKITTGVWLGYDRGRSLGRGETGGRAAAPVWLNFMRQAIQKTN